MEIPKEQAQQQTQESATTYYNTKRKHSFLYSRITVIISMVLLVGALGINLEALSSQERNTTQSKASTPEDQERSLPSLPAGCRYQQAGKGLAVICPTVIPTKTTGVPINVELPNLPPQCTFRTTTDGHSLECTTPYEPIPTVPVTLPQACKPTTQPNAVSCQDANRQLVTAPLPSLPTGCSYALLSDRYYVVCGTK